jgi:hypothetical protein
MREISAATGLNWRTVETAIINLLTHHLVEQHGRKWAALKPPEGWFATRPTSEVTHWFDRLATFPLFIPRKGATINGRRFSHAHTAIYSYLYSYAQKNDGKIVGKSTAWLCKSLNGLDRSTVQFSLTDLQSLNLIFVADDGTITVSEVPNDAIPYFAEQEAKPKAAPKAKSTELTQVRYKQPYQAMFDYCISQGIPQNLAMELTALAPKAALDLDAFIGLSEKAAYEHRRNRMNGKAESDHYGYLLRHKLQNTAAEEQKIQERIFSAPSDPPKEAVERDRDAERREQEEIDANPLHPRKYEFKGRDLMRRVQVSYQDAEAILSNVRDRCRTWLETKYPHHGFQFVVDETPRVAKKIMGNALNSLNDYYDKETKATTEQLYGAINNALMEGMEPLQP